MKQADIDSFFYSSSSRESKVIKRSELVAYLQAFFEKANSRRVDFCNEQRDYQSLCNTITVVTSGSLLCSANSKVREFIMKGDFDESLLSEAFTDISIGTMTRVANAKSKQVSFYIGSMIDYQKPLLCPVCKNFGSFNKAVIIHFDNTRKCTIEVLNIS